MATLRGRRKRTQTGPAAERNRERALTYYHGHSDELKIKSKARRLARLPEEREREKQTQKSFRLANPELVADGRLRRKYGITLQRRNEMLAEQGGACFLSGVTDFGKRGPQVDHDHANRVVRRILCSKVNVGLGALGDDPDLMRRSADYVEHYRLGPRVERLDVSCIEEHW